VRLHLTVIGCLLCCVTVFAAPPQLASSRLAKSPKIDGILSEHEWDGASTIDQFLDIQTDQATKDATQAWIGYDEKSIYVAFYAHESRPESLVAREIQRGSDFPGEDTVTFRLNPFGSKRWEGCSRFTVNLLNTQADSIAGGRAAKREWRGEWTSAVTKVKDGYVVEMAIPWKILNLPPAKLQTMDLNFERYQSRTLIYSLWANTTPNERPELMGRWLNVQCPATRVNPDWQFLGYAAPETDEGTSSFRAGIDARKALTPQVTGLVSIAPDFKNIEQDVEGVNFTRTERFLDDSRPFFTEGSGYFGIGGGGFGFGRMFYSRRIDRFDIGGKAFGQLNPNLSIGALTTIDYQDQLASVVKIAKSFGPHTYSNVYATNFEGTSLSNHAFGIGAGHRQGNFEANVNTAVEGSTSKMDSGGDAAISYSVPHIFSLLKYEWIKPNFDPALGYVPWTDRRGFYSYNEWNMEYRKGALRDAHADAYYSNFETYGGDEQQRGLELSTSVTTRNDVHFGLGHTQTSYYGALDRLNNINVNINQSNRYKRLGSYYEFGTRGGESSHYFGVDGSYRVFRRLDLGASQSVNSFQGTDNLTIITIGYELSPTRSVSGRFVTRNGDQNAYLAFRNGGDRGAELYVIVGDPNANKFQKRLSVKMVWAF
jgi:Domain of unknown function (DUF5916)